MGILKLKKRLSDHDTTENGEVIHDVVDEILSEDTSSDEEEPNSLSINDPTITADPQNDTAEPTFGRKKVMILASRGINARQRHLLDDLCLLMPHFKKESKFDAKRDLFSLNELAELNGCSYTVFFETRKPQELFMWLSKCPSGPSVRLHVQNIHTLEELHLTGNCMKNTRPILTFDPSFSSSNQGQIMKELLSAIFGVPNTHRKVRPYIDHVLHFGWSDDRIWARNYQIKEGVASDHGREGLDLEEIGPRFVLHPVMILEGSFAGRTLWRNPNYISMAMLRSSSKFGEALKHRQRVRNQEATALRKNNAILPDNELDHVFD